MNKQEEPISLIFLAGGSGTRMGASIPKQYLPLGSKPIVKYSLEVFSKIKEIAEIIIVAEENYHFLFKQLHLPVKFASPGPRRQDSVYNGLQQVHTSHKWVCIHDSARPFIDEKMVRELIQEGKKIGAATLGMPVKSTLKLCDEEGNVQSTLDRSKVWQIQTPQLLAKSLIEKGFEFAIKNEATVTDDTSLAELVGHPVKMVKGSYANIKITTPEDLIFARGILRHFKHAT